MDLISSWSVNPLSFMDSVNESIKDKAIDLAYQIFDGVVDKTPVLTGRARACWTLNEGSPVYNSIPEYGDASNPLDAPKRPILNNAPNNPVFYICNGQPYSVQLEHGYSGKAPLGMVRVTLAGLK